MGTEIHDPVTKTIEKPWKFWRYALLPLATGVGLVIYILTRLSLLLGVALAVLAGILSARTVWHRADRAQREIIKWRAGVGLAAGIFATIAYDASRYVIIEVFHFTFWPFDIFSIFGMLLIGDTAPQFLQTAVGVLFHYSNGIGFAIAFLFLFPRPNIRYGLLWAGILELFMVSLYPGWLGLKALDEFLNISIIGHVAYGTSLGIISRLGIEMIASKIDRAAATAAK